MMNRFSPRQIVYMIASNRIVQPVTVRDFIDDMYLVEFERSGSLWVHEDRLFDSHERADAYLKEFKKSRMNVKNYRQKLH